MTRQEITVFYMEHHRRLYNIAWRILRDSGEAEEVMQDTILKFVSEPREFASGAQVSAWLARTCIRASIDRLRRRRRETAFLEEYARQESGGPAGTQDSPSGLDPESPSFLPRIRSAMDALPEPYRLVLDLVLIEGLDYEEIAALTGQKETTLRSICSRGRNKLIEQLKKNPI